jgi:hypothetical protein
MSKLVIKKNPYLWEEDLVDEASGEVFKLKLLKKDLNKVSTVISSFEGVTEITENLVKTFFTLFLDEDGVNRIYEVLVTSKDDSFYTANEMMGEITIATLGKLGSINKDVLKSLESLGN